MTSTDLVVRLRETSDPHKPHDIGVLWNAIDEAADALEAKEREIEEIIDALNCEGTPLSPIATIYSMQEAIGYLQKDLAEVRASLPLVWNAGREAAALEAQTILIMHGLDLASCHVDDAVGALPNPYGEGESEDKSSETITREPASPPSD